MAKDKKTKKEEVKEEVSDFAIKNFLNLHTANLRRINRQSSIVHVLFLGLVAFFFIFAVTLQFSSPIPEGYEEVCDSWKPVDRYVLMHSDDDCYAFCVLCDKDITCFFSYDIYDVKFRQAYNIFSEEPVSMQECYYDCRSVEYPTVQVYQEHICNRTILVKKND